MGPVSIIRGFISHAAPVPSICGAASRQSHCADNCDANGKCHNASHSHRSFIRVLAPNYRDDSNGINYRVGPLTNLALGGDPLAASNVRFRGQSGHGFDGRRCLLLTQSGHRIGSISCSRILLHSRARSRASFGETVINEPSPISRVRPLIFCVLGS
jgi:hypothetical protein